MDSNAPPVLPAGITGEAWLGTIAKYAQKMRERLPNLTHPTDEYLTEGAQLFSQDRNPSAVGNSSSSPDAPQEARMVKIERILEEHTQRNTASEIRARQNYIEQPNGTGELGLISSTSFLVNSTARICLILRRTSWT